MLSWTKRPPSSAASNFDINGANAGATSPGNDRRSVLRALRDGTASDPELRGVWDEMEAWRLEGQGRFASMLGERGLLRAGRSIERARDIVWTVCSLPVHDLLVAERGWTSEQYQEWLSDALTCQLLDGRA
jgi:hypothetical protein